MKKNIMKIGFIIIIIIALIILGSLINIKESKTNTGIQGKSYETGYLEIPGKDSEKLIKNRKEFIQYFEKYEIDNNESHLEIFDLYDEQFFNNKQLAIIYQSLGSGMYSVKYKKCEIKDEVAYIEYEYITPKGEVTMEMSGGIIIVELPREVTSIVADKVYKDK